MSERSTRNCVACKMDGIVKTEPDRNETPGMIWLAGFTYAHARSEGERDTFVRKLCPEHALAMTMGMAMAALQEPREEQDEGDDG